MSNICQECGMNVEPGEFHPYEFCLLYKAGQDPRALYKRIVEHNKAQKPKQPEWLSQALNEGNGVYKP